MGMIINPSRFASAGGGPVSTMWRLNFLTKQGGGNWLQLSEVELRGAIGGADLATGGTASASAVYAAGYEASKAFDNNTGTTWTTGTSGMPQWLQYTFATGVSIVEVSIRTSPSAGDSPTSFNLQYYNGSTWITTLTVSATGSWVNNETKVFS